MTEPITETPEEDMAATDRVDALELSDEEFAKLSEPVAQEETPTVEETPGEGEGSEEAAAEEEAEPETDPEAEGGEPGEPDDSDPGSGTPAPDDTGEPGSPEEKEEAPPEGEKAEDTKEKGTDDVPLVDYKAEYEKLMAPFKANGMDMQAKNVDDAIQLMKMGAGFHKKMAALKPAMRQMKLLEKAGLLDDEKLNYLIDLNDRKPEAIQKLLKDSNIDPLDIDVKADTNYKPTERKVSDTELALEDVINEIRDTPTYQRTLTVVSKEWDESSQNAIATEPQVIATLNGHMQDGTFDAVMTRVEYERSLGRLTGLSDIQAYMQMGNAMVQEGKLHAAGAPQQTVEQPVVQPPKVEPSKKEIERKKKKRAASPVKTSRTTAEPTFDPLDMSDEDFAKLDINKYIKS